MLLYNLLDTSKILLLLLGLSCSFLTVLFVNKVEEQTVLNFYDYIICLILTFVFLMLFPFHYDGEWNWYVITGILSGLTFLKIISRYQKALKRKKIHD